MAAFKRADESLRELALFAGSGGGILGGKLLGWRTVCAVECDAYAAGVLVARQNDGCLDPFPIWDDVRTFDGKPWRGRVDVVSGGFPCQDISAAGKGAGIDGERSGLWREMSRIIGEVRPRFAFVENSPRLVRRGLGRVLGDLAELGYDAAWGIVSAADAIWLAGDPCLDHERKRIWIVAQCSDSDGHGRGAWRESARRQTRTNATWLREKSGLASTSHSDGPRSNKRQTGKAGRRKSGRVRAFVGDSAGSRLPQRESEQSDAGEEHATAERASWWTAEPAVGRVAHGVASRVDRLRAVGNGQVPLVAAIAWRVLTGGDDEVEIS